MRQRDSGGGRRIGRRGFLGGLSGLLAASAYSLTVPETVAAQVTSGDDGDIQQVTSPDGSIVVTVDVTSGVPTYEVEFAGTTYVEQSPIGFLFDDQPTFGTGVFGTGPDVTVTGTERETATETWEPEWGGFDTVSAEYSALTVGLAETTAPGRTANLELRVFDDGFGFRVVFGESFGSFSMDGETTEFDFAGDYTSWWIENEWVNPRFEQEYTESPLSEIPAGNGTTRPNDTPVRRGAHTPLTMRADDGTYLSVHESNLDDYAKMSLAPVADDGSSRMAVELAPLPDGSAVKATAPHATPWRTIQIGTSPGELVESQLIPLLADPLDESAFPTSGGGVDTSWVDARTYVGVWWLMIAGSANWEYKSDSELSNAGQNPARYVHGARTERTKRYMRFASEHRIDSVLVEGWNQGWSTYPGDGTGFEMGVDDSYPDFDVQTVTDYGASLSPSVEMTMHNETAGNVVTYEDEIDDGIFGEYEAAGIRSVKNGYVKDPGLGFEGDGAWASHTHHCQRAVNHHRLVAQAAAANRQMLEVHEGIVPTGEHRTYPNVAAREVVKAQEYDGFGELGAGVGRDHHVTLPFTRMLAGPTSYQPGIFDTTFTDNDSDARIETTVAKQLAMYPTYLGGLQMAADRIEAYVDRTLAVGEFVQASSADLDGMITADEWRNSYGGHYVPIDPSREPDGATATFTVKNVPSAGTYDLHLRYAADSDENRWEVTQFGSGQATLVVNGSEREITPPFTNYWDDWEIHTVSVDLQAGDNTVAVKLRSGDVGGFNLDAVGVSEPGAGSPVAADYGSVDPSRENYDTVPAFKFVEQVPTDWDETRVLDAGIGEYVVTARRAGDEWYVGAMTNGDARSLTVSLEFLSAGSYTVTGYADAPGTDVETNPTEVEISEYGVSAGDTVELSMGASGGTALRIRPS